MAIQWRRPSFTVTLIWVFLPLVCGTGLLVAWMESRRMAQLLTAASEETLQAMVGDLRSSWARVVDPRLVEMDLDLLAEMSAGPDRAHHDETGVHADAHSQGSSTCLDSSDVVVFEGLLHRDAGPYGAVWVVDK